MTKRAIAIGIIWTLLLLGASLLVIIGLKDVPYEFIGQRNFATAEEAQMFREELVDKANRVHASISTDLSYTNGFTRLSYIAHMPTYEAFEYGKRTLSLTATRIMQTFFTIIYTTICILIWGDLRRRGNEKWTPYN